MRTLTKYTSAAGSEARSRPRTLLLCLNTQGRLIIMNYGNTRYLSPFSSPIAPPSGVLLARPRTSFIFFARSSDFDTGVQVDSEISFLSFARKSASATPVRGSTRYRTGTVLEYIDFNLLAKTIRHCIQVPGTLKYMKSQHTRTHAPGI